MPEEQNSNSLRNWVATFVAIVSGLIGVRYILVEDHEHLSHALDAMTKLVALDESLLRLLPQLAAGADRPGTMKRLLNEFLRDATRVFNGEVQRAMILLPDAEGDYLVPWVTYQMPQEDEDNRRFYIGSNRYIQSGIAGETFLNGTPLVVHFTEQDDHWVPDNSRYINLHPDRPFPPYRAIATIPILGSRSDSLGVLCFDSMNRTVFDPPDTQQLLLALAARIAATILIYKRLTDNPDEQATRHPRSS